MTGTTVADRLRDVLQEEAPGYIQSGGADIADFDFSRGEARFTWPDDILAALVAPRSAQLRYQDPRGAQVLRTAFLAGAPTGTPTGVPTGAPTGVCDRLDASNVLVTSGAKQALWLAFSTRIKSGDRVLLPRPGWSPYAVWTRTLGGRISWYDPRDVSAHAVLRDIAARSCEHVVFNSPHNPTGVEYDQLVIDAIAAATAAAGVSVISDEVYRCFARSGGTFLPHVDPDEPRVVVADSLSKSAGAAGLRVGFLVGSRSTINDATVIRGVVDSCPPGVTQSAAAFLLSEAARPFRTGIRNLAHKAVHGLAELLRADGILVESFGGLYVWIQTTGDDGRVQLADGRVLLGTPGAVFGTGGYVRLCPVTDDAKCAALLKTDLALEAPPRVSGQVV